MKCVMLSIRPKYCELIASGKKTVEVRKTKPKIDVPFKCYIYCTKGDWLTSVNGKVQKPNNMVIDLSADSKVEELNGKVIGEFVCDWVVDSPIWRLRGNTGFLAPRTEKEKNLPEMACLSLDELKAYVGSENKCVCAWHISDLVIYDKPKDLSEFVKPCDHDNDCFTCDRYDYIGHKCYNDITRPPQSYMFVEELLPQLSEPKGKTIQFKKWTYDEHKGE